ncbi:hypothetical protein AgCh_034168 [Apium graveolens]
MEKKKLVIQNKARLVTKGYSQEEGIDYDKIFAPVARLEAIRIFLAFATLSNFKVYQIDVKSAFLNGELEEEVFMKHPPGFEDLEFPYFIYRRLKAIYDLKHAPKTCVVQKLIFSMAYDRHLDVGSLMPSEQSTRLTMPLESRGKKNFYPRRSIPVASTIMAPGPA